MVDGLMKSQFGYRYVRIALTFSGNARASNRIVSLSPFVQVPFLMSLIAHAMVLVFYRTQKS